MASPYPVELRERAVAAYQEGNGTLAEIAVLFIIGIATLKRWWWRFSKTGSVAPLPHGGGQPAKIDKDGEIVLREWVTAQPDLTLDELVEKYQEYFKVQLSQAAMSRTLLRLQLVRKKSRSTRPSGTTPRSSGSASNTARRRRGSTRIDWSSSTKRDVVSE